MSPRARQAPGTAIPLRLSSSAVPRHAGTVCAQAGTQGQQRPTTAQGVGSVCFYPCCEHSQAKMV